MSNNTNREGQFHRTPAVIEARRNALQELSFDELAEIFIREGAMTKQKLIGFIMENDAKKYHPITEERYQFVEWLYRIRKQYRRMGLFQPDFICIIFCKILVSKYQRSDGC